MSEEKILKVMGGAFIDPADCGSMVRWIVDLRGGKPNPAVKHHGSVKTGYTRLDAKVGLSDCSRHIEWDLSASKNYGRKLEKIQAAIDELTKARDAIAHAQAAAAKFRKKHGIVQDDDIDED